jgi:N-acetylneuraminate synthase/N,N'-diacetyllegionaminate synthase
VRIGPRTVGDGRPVYVIAEAGVNHDGDPDAALALVDAAAAAGADAVKFQTFRTEALVVRGTPKARYQVETTGPAGGMDDLVARLELSAEVHRRLAARARERDLDFLSTPFDEESLRLLVDVGVPAVKVASGEATNLPFLRAVARTGLPVLLSTGMCDVEEVRAALGALADAAGTVLLHCVSAYPAPLSELNLRAIGALRDAFGVPVGWSDHTQGLEAPLAAVALGACVVERHLTLDRSRPGPDHRASSEPDDFRRMVEGIRRVESALGDGVKRPAACEADVRRLARRSVVTARAVPAGRPIVREDLAVKRPGTGIAPADLERVVGCLARADLAADTVLDWALLTPPEAPRR